MCTMGVSLLTTPFAQGASMSPEHRAVVIGVHNHLLSALPFSGSQEAGDSTLWLLGDCRGHAGWGSAEASQAELVVEARLGMRVAESLKAQGKGCHRHIQGSI